jgi:hypothetical protein
LRELRNRPVHSRAASQAFDGHERRLSWRSRKRDAGARRHGNLCRRGKSWRPGAESVTYDD